MTLAFSLLGLQACTCMSKEMMGWLNFLTNISFVFILKEMLAILEDERQHEDHEEGDAFICIILSHGAMHNVMGIDGVAINIHNQIVPKFNAENCPALKNKPKLLLINACQGWSYTPYT